MVFSLKKKITICFLTTIFLASIFAIKFVYAEDPTPTPTPQNTSQEEIDLQNKIRDLENKISDLQGQEKTLSSQIDIMDSQINLTEARIAANKRDILDISLDIDTTTKKISSLEASLDDITGVLINRIVATYEAGKVQPLEVLLTSGSASDLLMRINYLRIAQAHDKKLIYDVTQAKNDFTNQKEIFEEKKKKIEDLKKQLEVYTNQLNQEKQTKENLLAQTKGSEATYQSLLAEAKAQLAGFSSFAQNQGGASLLSNQTVCDDWGCYYNQRDSQWGANSLNGTQYTLASDGCLVTSMAMVYTHYGHKSVTPQTINSDSSNFASYYPAYLNFEIKADGVTSKRVDYSIDSELQAGRPVIVGIKYSNGDTHFVVLVDYNGGNYLMNDPFTPNGHRIPFTSKYSLGSIFAIYKINGF